MPHGAGRTAKQDMCLTAFIKFYQIPCAVKSTRYCGLHDKIAYYPENRKRFEPRMKNKRGLLYLQSAELHRRHAPAADEQGRPTRTGAKNSSFLILKP